MKIGELEGLLNRIPRRRIIFLPTPFHKLENLTQKYGVEMYMKRDDLTGPSVYGGNKTRKLEFILESALEHGIEYFISIGGYQTNSGMELTSCCRKYGVKSILYLMDILGQGVPQEYRGNLLLNKLMGCELHYVERPLDEDLGTNLQRCLELCEKRRQELEKRGHKSMVLSVGVDAPEGWVSYVLGFKEIMEQSKELGMNLDYLFHATGTGGTLSGLIAGKFLLESDVKIISIGVAPRSITNTGEETICDRVEMTLHQLGVNPPDRKAILREINIDRSYAGEGYCVPTEESTRAIKELATEEGLILDPVYTGKAFAGFLDYIRSSKISQGSKTGFLHTGGTGAIFVESKMTGKITD